jgi:hypothetical protein
LWSCSRGKERGEKRIGSRERWVCGRGWHGHWCKNWSWSWSMSNSSEATVDDQTEVGFIMDGYPEYLWRLSDSRGVSAIRIRSALSSDMRDYVVPAEHCVRKPLRRRSFKLVTYSLDLA